MGRFGQFWADLKHLRDVGFVIRLPKSAASPHKYRARCAPGLPMAQLSSVKMQIRPEKQVENKFLPSGFCAAARCAHGAALRSALPVGCASAHHKPDGMLKHTLQ